MKKNLYILLGLAFLIFLVYHNAFSNFFAQDDFILLQKFSGSGFWTNLITALTSYHETHWRPVHNLFFLLSGNIFGKNYTMYHILLFVIHLTTSYLIFLVSLRIFKNRTSALVSSIIYAIHPFNFISLFWISGGATELAFMFFLISFIFWLNNKLKYFLLFFVISLLASESMIVGILIILVWELFVGNLTARLKDLKISLLVATLFVVLRFVFLTPRDIYGVYGVKISYDSILALKYYLLRVLGFAETNGDLLISVVLSVWFLVILVLFIKTSNKHLQYKNIFFFLCVFAFGLLPFIAIPNHLSPHYMNISVWAYASIVSVLLAEKVRLYYPLVFIFFIICFFSAGITQENSWVVARASLSKRFISQIEKEDLPSGSILVFDDNYVSSSLDAYYALGGGDAINFWFKNKNYKFCFTEFESCNTLP